MVNNLIGSALKQAAGPAIVLMIFEFLLSVEVAVTLFHRNPCDRIRVANRDAIDGGVIFHARADDKGALVHVGKIVALMQKNLKPMKSVGNQGAVVDFRVENYAKSRLHAVFIHHFIRSEIGAV